MVLTCKRYLINLKIEASLLAKFFLSNPFMGNGKYNFLSKSLAKTRKKKKVILISNNRHLRCDKYHLCNFFMSINISKYTIVYCSTKRYKFRENQSVKIFPPYFNSWRKRKGNNYYKIYTGHGNTNLIIDERFDSNCRLLINLLSSVY